MSNDYRSDLYFWRNDLDQDSKTGDESLHASSVYSEWLWKSKNQAFELKSQFSWGSADTLSLVKNIAANQFISKYNIIDEAQDLRSYLTSTNKLTSSRLEQLLPKQIDISANDALQEIKAIEEKALEQQRDKQVAGLVNDSKNIAVGFDFDFTYSAGGVKALFRHIGSDLYSVGAKSLLNNSRELSLDWNHEFFTNWGTQLKVSTIVENASQGGKLNFSGLELGNLLALDEKLSSYAFSNTDDNEPRYLYDINLENKVSFGQVDLELGYKFSWKHQLSDIQLLKDTTLEGEVYTDAYFRANDNSSLEKLYLNTIYTIDTTKWNQFKSLSDTLASNLIDKELAHKINFILRWNFNKEIQLKLGAELSVLRDRSNFNNWNDDGQKMKLNDKTWDKLGYFFNERDELGQSYPLTLSYQGEYFSQSLNLEYYQLNYVSTSDLSTEYNASWDFEWEFIPEKWTIAMDIGLRYEFTEFNQDIHFLQNSEGKNFYFYSEESLGDSLVIVSPQTSAQRTSQLVDVGIQPDGFELMRRTENQFIEQIDPYVDFSLSYNYTDELSLEGEVSLLEYRRPQSLSEEYRDFTTLIRALYNF